MTRPTVIRAITEEPANGGLGYCCPWFFFQHYHRCTTIAMRLGFSVRQVQMLKAECLNGERKCEGKGSCMHKRITLEGSSRKIKIEKV